MYLYLGKALTVLDCSQEPMLQPPIVCFRISLLKYECTTNVTMINNRKGGFACPFLIPLIMENKTAKEIIDDLNKKFHTHLKCIGLSLRLREMLGKVDFKNDFIIIKRLHNVHAIIMSQLTEFDQLKKSIS